MTRADDRQVGLPPGFLERMEHWLGDEARAYLDSLAEPPATGLRVNTRKVTPGDLAWRMPWCLVAVPWCPAGYALPEEAGAGWHPYHAAGLYYLQEPSAMLPGEVLAPQPGEWVLDVCGAPGGKATHLAALMEGRGWLVANDIVLSRARVLAENLERWGATNAVVLSETPERLASRWPQAFDRVLVDAPCSGEGMFRKSPQAIRDWSPEQVVGCALRQSDILASAAQMVRPGGWLVYSTCTFAPEENEGVLASFLASHPHYVLEEVTRAPGFGSGRPDWVGARGDVARQLARVVRLWPHRVRGDGHVVALLRRMDTQVGEPPLPPLVPEAPREARDAWEAFCQATLTTRPSVDLLLTDEWLFAAGVGVQQLGVPDLSGLRALRPGWHLGFVRKGRFEPGHALALGLEASQVQRSVDLAADGPKVRRYLRGETLRTSGPDGWLLVTVDGFSVGWAKAVRGVAKNHYPKALRWSWR